MKMQQTIKNSIHINGIGLHSGQVVRMTLHPAAENTGIIFNRIDLANSGKNTIVEAIYNNVVDTKLCTKIANSDNVSVATIEHLMSALFAFGIDNVFIDIDAPEVPAMDGSSDPYLFLFESVGVNVQKSSKKIIKILEKVVLKKDHWSISLEPSDEFVVDCTIDFPGTIIGKQHYYIAPNIDKFSKEIANARTFAQIQEIDSLRKIGLALGGSYENAVIVDGMKVLNPTGLRFKDEFVRHKVLDMFGDLFLAGAYLQCKVISNCAGHTANNLILRELFSDSSNYKIISEYKDNSSLFSSFKNKNKFNQHIAQ